MGENGSGGCLVSGSHVGPVAGDRWQRRGLDSAIVTVSYYHLGVIRLPAFFSGLTADTPLCTLSLLSKPNTNRPALSPQGTGNIYHLMKTSACKFLEKDWYKFHVSAPASGWSADLMNRRHSWTSCHVSLDQWRLLTFFFRIRAQACGLRQSL